MPDFIPEILEQSDEQARSVSSMIGESLEAGSVSSSESELRKNELSNEDHVSIYSKTDPSCRICWGENNTRANPLLRVCLCRGGVEFIHYECIRSWLKTKERRVTRLHSTVIYW